MSGGCRDEAERILSTFDQATPRPLIAWAVGVWQFGHAIHLRTPLLPDVIGRSLAGGRWYRATGRRGWVIASGTTVHASGAWAEVTSLMRYGALPADLRGQVERAWSDRKTRIGVQQRDRDWYATPEARHERALWTAIERRCHALGALAWELWRPAVDTFAVQLDLFAEVS